MSGPSLRCTKNYSIFEMHDLNRPIKEKPSLEDSMAQFGFMPSSPIQCVQSATPGKLKVIRGHHRLYYAVRMGLPVWYVVDDSNTDIHSLEGDPSVAWNALDFAQSHKRAGDSHYMTLIEFMDKHNLTLGSAASLVGGESAGSNNKIRDVKRGVFRVGDMTHADNVVRITDLCQEVGIVFATSTSFVSAVSLALRVPEFDWKIFCQKVRLYPAHMSHRSRADEYLDEIDALYNYNARGNRLPVKFRATEVARERKENFGDRKKRSS